MPDEPKDSPSALAVLSPGVSEIALVRTAPQTASQTCSWRTSSSITSSSISSMLSGAGLWADWSKDSYALTVTLTNNSATWGSWANETPIIYAGSTSYTAPHRQTEAERAASLARQNEESARHAVAKSLSNAKAEALLRAHLDDNQQGQLIQEDRFLVTTRAGNRYLINRGRSANIDVLDALGQVVHSLCAHPSMLVPDADTMLSQMLMLLHDEPGFLKLANKHQKNHGFRSRPLMPLFLPPPPLPNHPRVIECV